jgi:hypothetical protein
MNQDNRRRVKSVSFDLFDDTYQKNVGRIEIKFDEDYKRLFGLNNQYSIEQVIVGQLVKNSNFCVHSDSVEYVYADEPKTTLSDIQMPL